MNTETKHTPGPWIVDDQHIHPANGLTYPAGQEPETDIIALVDTDHHTNGLLNDTDKANLRLIASAPAMLDELATLRADKAELVGALRGLLDVTHKQGHGWIPLNDEIHAKITVHQAKFSSADTKARALIAKHTKP